jgi:hypothetical protein
VKWHSRRACKGGREGEKERGGQRQWCPFKGERREAEEGGGSRVDVRVEEGEGRRGGPRAAAGDAGWAAPAQSRRMWVAVHGRAETGEAGDVDRWAWGHSNGRRGQNDLNRFKIQMV